MILVVLLSTGLAAAAPADPFAVAKVTLDAHLNRPPVRLSAHRLAIVRDAIIRGSLPSTPRSQHDDALETSGPVIRTEKGLLHCRGHRFPAVAGTK